ncbi:MAG: M28 family peptidase [Cytophagaceae bacterium]
MKKMLYTSAFIVILISAFIFLIKNPILGKVLRDLNANVPVSEENLKNTVKFLTTTTKPRNFYNQQSLNASAAFIMAEFKKYGYQVEEQKYLVEGVEVKNIICSYGPEDAERIIVGAHYDVCEEQAGADDNASGVAGLLELARILQVNKPELKYRIDLVAYTLEEPPFFRTSQMGSAVHAKYLSENNIKVKAMICLEMIGYFSDKPKSQEYPVKALKTLYPSTGNFIAVVGKMGDSELTKHMKKKMLEGSSIGVESINAPESMTGIDFSDHLNYWKYKFSAIMITDTSFYRNKNYHQKSDTMDTLNFSKMAEVVKGVYWGLVSF